MSHIVACCIPDPEPVKTDSMLHPRQVARIAHEINAAYCRALGDDSQPEWDNAPDWQKDSAVNGVKFHLEHPDSTPEDSHKSWLKQKEAEGWKYGKVKNAETKEHPCFVPYDELPTENKAKDYLFKQVVASLREFLPVAPKEEA